MLNCIWEHNGDDTLLYSGDYPGAFTRGANLTTALEKLPAEIAAYCRWCGRPMPTDRRIRIVQEQRSTLRICDADSDVIFDTERLPLPAEEYTALKQVVLRSAADFQRLYETIPDKDVSALPPRDTFYGPVPRTAREMLRHTQRVTAYYFGEIGVDTDNEGTLVGCRERGLARLEAAEGYLRQPPVEGSYGEWWSLRKVLRRFVWHDRIHARALYRMARLTFPQTSIPDVFRFEK